MKRFVPAADEVSRLQRGKTPDGELFRSFCEEGHYGGRTQPTATRQGIYAVAPSGRFLASINTRSARKVARMLEQALSAWDELPPDARRLDGDRRQALQSTRRWRDHYPEDGLVLEVTTRDLRDPSEVKGWRGLAWNIDYAWFRKPEAISFVAAEPAVGATHDVPDKLVQRIARFHLVDNVRGQTSGYKKDSVEVAKLATRVTAIDGDVVQLSLQGETRTRQRGTWSVRGFKDMKRPSEQERGFETQLRGTATYDRARERFTAFELIAVGKRWGATQYNARSDDVDATRVGVVLRLADPAAGRVAPAHIWGYGWRR